MGKRLYFSLQNTTHPKQLTQTGMLPASFKQTNPPFQMQALSSLELELAEICAPDEHGAERMREMLVSVFGMLSCQLSSRGYV